MSEVIRPPCPECRREMQLKQVFRQQQGDHHVFQCTFCKLEYPVIAKGLGLTTDENKG